MINQLELLFSGPFKFMDKGAEERARGAREQVPRKSKTKNGSEVVERPPPPKWKHSDFILDATVR